MAIFPKVICLTLPEQRDRQKAVVREFTRVGIDNYAFFPGFAADAEAVKQAYAQNRVKRYPDCFRCGKRDCGKPDCNNVLLPVQVAVALGFQAMLKTVAQSEQPYAAICEDDIIFAGYAKRVFAAVEFQQLIESCGLLGDKPALLRLTRPGIDKNTFFTTDIELAEALRTSDKIVMSNPFFLVNKAFARIAYQRLDTIDHTADVIIHQVLAPHAQCFTLESQPVADRSWGVGDVPSLIHPKAQHVEYLRGRYGEASPQVARETERLKKHTKKAQSRRYCFIGSPRCGSHYVSAFLRRNGLDIGHELLGADGICAWQFTASSNQYPYISDPQAQSDFFVHAERWFVYARNPVSAIPSLIVENEKAPLSYAFRRELIYQHYGVNLDDFASPIERAARAYAHWYMLALARKPEAVLRVEHFLADCRQYIGDHQFEAVEIEAKESGAGKPYMGVIHVPAKLDSDWAKAVSNTTLDILASVAAALGYSMD